MKTRITLPESVDNIIKKLQNAGFEAYAVGGCVRDSILERVPNDWDITTSALPLEVKSLFRRTVDTGIQHGTVTVLVGGDSYEVTTYRTDGEYKDARHPKKVEFVKNLRDDLQRRDFTINAMAYNYDVGLQDPFGGLADIEKQTVRCVGDAYDRLSEDALRIFRAVRFSAQLSFSIDADTKKAITDLAPNLSKISAERICTELIKLITSDHPEYIRQVWELGMTKVFMPQFDRLFKTEQNTPYHVYNVGDHTIKTMQNIESDKVLRLTMLLHDIGKPDARRTDENGRDHFKMHADYGIEISDKIMRSLKLDNDTIRKVKHLIKYHDWRFDVSVKNVRRAINVLGEDMFPDFLKVIKADAAGKSTYRQKETEEHIKKMEELYEYILKEDQCVSIKNLKISGNDVIEVTGLHGPAIGEMLTAALDEVIDDPQKNNREYLLEFVRDKAKNKEKGIKTSENTGIP